MNARSIVTGAFLALIPALVVGFAAGALVGGAPEILAKTDPLVGTGSGVKHGSAGSDQFWQALIVTFVLIEVVGTFILARWMHRAQR